MKLTQKFQEYVKGTWDLYMKYYSWYYMPPTLHKLLVHGPAIIMNCILPIGQMSEEAQEARNKDFRYYRQHNTRKNSRFAINEDLMNMLLVSSDPYISLLRSIPKSTTSTAVPYDVLQLLSDPSEASRNQENVFFDEDECYDSE